MGPSAAERLQKSLGQVLVQRLGLLKVGCIWNGADLIL